MIQPIAIPVTGQCDATGAGQIIVNAPVEFWSAVWLAVEVSGGTPAWTVRESGASGLPIIFGGGPQSTLGPFVVPPRKILLLTLTGAAANATVDGQLMGWSASTFQELPKQLPLSSGVFLSGGTVNATIQGTPSVVISGTPTVQFAAGQTVNIQNVTGTVNVQGITGGVNVGTNTPQKLIDGPRTISTQTSVANVALPTGTNALIVLSTNFNFGSVSVTGHQSNFPYITGGTSTVGIIIVPITGADTAVDLVYNVTQGSSTFNTIALIGSEGNYVINAPAVNIQASGTPLISIGDSLKVTRTDIGNAGPALWEAPQFYNHIERTTTGLSALISNVVNQRIRIFSIFIAVDNANAFADVEDDAATPQVLTWADSRQNSGAQSNAITTYPGGLLVPAGRTINLNAVVIGPATTAKATVVYSQR